MVNYNEKFKNELLLLRKRPAMWLGGDTCQLLYLYIQGVSLGASLIDDEVSILKENFLDNEFTKYIQEIHNEDTPAKNWATVLDEYYSEFAIENFFYYWEQFIALKNKDI